MEVKHTPGPWYFDGTATSIIVWSGPRERVCFMTSDGPVKANACLVAAAPELLEAAKWTVERQCEGFCKDLPRADTYNEQMDFDCAACRARVAIAKAEGKDNG